MNPIESVKHYLDDDNSRMIIFDKEIFISNYQNIKSFDSNKFILSFKDKEITLNGKNITIKKLSKEDVLISGSINSIEFR